MLSEKGKYATATQNRRTVWEKINGQIIFSQTVLLFCVAVAYLPFSLNINT